MLSLSFTTFPWLAILSEVETLSTESEWKPTTSAADINVVKMIKIPGRNHSRRTIKVLESDSHKQLLFILCTVIVILDGFGIFLYRWVNKEQPEDVTPQILKGRFCFNVVLCCT